MLLLTRLTEANRRLMLLLSLGTLYSLSLRLWVFHPQTRMFVWLLGPCFKTVLRKPFRQNRISPSGPAVLQSKASSEPGKSLYLSSARDPILSSTRRGSSSAPASGPFEETIHLHFRKASRAFASFLSFLLNDFKSFNPLFKVLFIFPSQYLFAIGFPLIFSFRRSLSPILGWIPKQPDSKKVCIHLDITKLRGCNPLCRLIPKDLWSIFVIAPS